MLPLRPALTVAALVAGALTAVPAAPAVAAASGEVALRPADGVLRFEGKGWGHGRGLGQWGAQGAALQGVAYPAILERYYPRTTAVTVPDRQVRVWFEDDDETDVVVAAADGLAVRDLATGEVFPLPPGPDRWRVTRTSAGQHLASGDGGSWVAYALGGRTAVTGPLRFEGTPTTTVLLPGASRTTFRGTITAANLDGLRVGTVNTLSLEQYLWSVVPSEAPASWHAEALKAQSVAARTYSLRKVLRASASGPYDICSTVSCQVYKGLSRTDSAGRVVTHEKPSTTAAVTATRGQVRHYEGAVAFTEFSSSTGGHTTAGSVPYQVAQPDPWDAVASPHHLWRGQVPVAALERRFPALGRLERLVVTARDGNGAWGGRVRTVVLEGRRSDGTATRVTTTGAGVYQAAVWPGVSTGLRGSWWRVTSAAPPAETLSARATGGPAGDAVRADGTVAVQAGGTSTVRLQWVNTGSATWRAGQVWLAPSGPRGRTSVSRAPSWADGTRAGALTADTPPGATGTFTLELAGAGGPVGRSAETFEPVWPGRAWLGAARTLSLVRYDTALPRHAVAEGAAAPVALLAYPGPGRSATVAVRLLNTGGSAWPLGGADVGGGDRLATGGPEPLRTAAWPAPDRTPALAVNVTDPAAGEVRPGEVGQWQVPLDAARSAAGSRDLVLRPHDGTGAWGPEVRVPVTVRAGVLTAARAAVVPYRAVVPSARYVKVTVDVRNTGNLPWPVARTGGVRLATVGNVPSPSRNAGWLAPAQPGAVAANVTRPGAATVGPGETARFALWLSGNGRRAGTVTESFTVLWHGWRYSGLRLPVTYRVTR